VSPFVWLYRTAEVVAHDLTGGATAVAKAALLLAVNLGSFAALLYGAAVDQWGPVGVGLAGLTGVFAILVRDRRAEEEIRDDLRAVVAEAREEARAERARARRAETELIRNGIPVPDDVDRLPSGP